LFSRAGLLALALLLAGPLWASAQGAAPDGQAKPSSRETSANYPPADEINPEDIVNPEARRTWEEALARAHRFDDVPPCSQEESDAYLESQKDHPDRYHDPDGSGYSLDKRNDLATTSTIKVYADDSPRCKLGPFPEMAPPPKYDFANHPIAWKDVPDHIGELFELVDFKGLVTCPDYVEQLGDQYFSDHDAIDHLAGSFFGEPYSRLTYDLGGGEYCVKMLLPEPHDLSPDEAQILLSLEVQEVSGPVTMKMFFGHTPLPETEKAKKKRNPKAR